MKHEAWIWTELLAFDNTQKDFGVVEYINRTGFVPEAICLLSSTPDIVFQHCGMDKEIILSPAVCSRDGHSGNEERKRQAWTNFQVKALIEELHRTGTQVYLSLFTVYYEDRYQHEWMSDHPEVLQEWDFQGKGLNINVLRRLKDGRYVEDIFIDKVVQITLDYGFDGWHGPDGYGPLTSGAIAYTDCGDDIMKQFAETLDCKLPECVACVSNGNTDILQKRMNWIWGNLRKEWIRFNTGRWAAFWTKMTAAMHKINKKTVINSAWTRACFEAEYRYGIDYKKIMDTNVDYMIVETVAAAVALSNGAGYDSHYEYLSMLMEIKAYAPDMKLIILHGVKDACERWDLLRHAPTMPQREFYALANVYYDRKRILKGWLTCLGDDIRPEEWKMLRDLYASCVAGKSKKQGNVTVIWSDNAYSKLLDDYLQYGTWNTAMQMQCLMERGAQIQNIARIENLDEVDGTIFVANSHLLNPAELQKIRNYRCGEVIMTERRVDKYVCKTLNKNISSSPCPFEDKKPPAQFKDSMSYCAVNDEFWDKIADAMSADSIVSTDNRDVSFMTQIIDKKSFILGIINKKFTYQRPKIIFTRNIKKLEVISRFPPEQEFSGKSFILQKLPPKGVVSVKVTLSEELSG
jgi:hypothetical protein